MSAVYLEHAVITTSTNTVTANTIITNYPISITTIIATITVNIIITTSTISTTITSVTIVIITTSPSPLFF